MPERHQRRFFLRMSFYDNEGNTFGERAIEIDSAWCGARPSFIHLSPPSPFDGEVTMSDAVEVLHVRELRRKEFAEDATRIGHALADHLEDKEGWHGVDRQERTTKIAD